MTNTANETKLEMAHAEGFSIGMIERSYWDGDVMSKPTDSDLEAVAEKVFARFGLKFESNFDGRMSFIAGYWQGWKKAEQPRPEWQLRMEVAHAEMMEVA
jgi:hypothetical protein